MEERKRGIHDITVAELGDLGHVPARGRKPTVGTADSLRHASGTGREDQEEQVISPHVRFESASLGRQQAPVSGRVHIDDPVFGKPEVQSVEQYSFVL